MDKVYFAIALHFHQPIGNFENIFERAYSFCYKPFLQLLFEYPDIKATIHISGCLLDYLEDKHLRLLRLIKGMVSRGQVEIMAGGYYEPILTAIPQRDVLGQIDMMKEYIKKRFKVTPKGMWVAERVWDPSLVRIIYNAGIRYIILDDEHLLRSGITKENMHGFFLTGKGKEKIAVFPSDKQLRYKIPFKLPHETIDYFKSAAHKKKNILFTYGDDGEKFGEWPGTHKWVYEDKWLYNFFEILKQNKGWVKTVHFSDYLNKNKPQAVSEINQGSYEEMMEWSKGNWLNFLSIYPEAGQMHKKMLYVSEKLETTQKQCKRNYAKKLKEARKELYKGECNCAYWHGVFGGLYLYHLRSAVYTHLIKADKILDEISSKNKKGWLNITEIGFDKRNEFLIEDENFSVCIDPQEGGVIKELDLRAINLNIVNTLSRKKEAYHQKILDLNQQAHGAKVATIHGDFRTVDPSFRNMLIYDRYSRYFLRSYFTKKGLKVEDFIASSFTELGDFSCAPYAAKKEAKGVILERNAKISGESIRVGKAIRIKSKNKIEIICSVAQENNADLGALFGLEFNVTMPCLDSDRYSYISDGHSKGNLHAHGESLANSFFGIRDSLKEFGISFYFSRKPTKILYFPVKTISQSERAYESNYQCSCIFFAWDINTKNKNIFKIDFVAEA